MYFNYQRQRDVDERGDERHRENDCTSELQCGWLLATLECENVLCIFPHSGGIHIHFPTVKLLRLLGQIK